MLDVRLKLLFRFLQSTDRYEIRFDSQNRRRLEAELKFFVFSFHWFQIYFQVYPQENHMYISCHMFPLVVYNMLASILHRIESLSFPHSMHTRGCSMVAASA